MCPIAFAHHASKFDGWRAQAGTTLDVPHGRRSVALVVIR
jgi:hypothetical protein